MGCVGFGVSGTFLLSPYVQLKQEDSESTFAETKLSTCPFGFHKIMTTAHYASIGATVFVRPRRSLVAEPARITLASPNEYMRTTKQSESCA